MLNLKTAALRLAVIVLASAVHGGVRAQSDDGGPYTVQPGDVLQISVWKEEDLQREVVVRPDGGISFPLAGDLLAAGMTLDAIRDDVSRKLERYIPDAVVTVAVGQIVGNKIYVEGKVNRPGEYVMSRNVDIMQALSMAGGMTAFADRNDIKILRRVDGRLVAYDFRYAEVASGQALEQNIVLKSGDIVVVP